VPGMRMQGNVAVGVDCAPYRGSSGGGASSQRGAAEECQHRHYHLSSATEEAGGRPRRLACGCRPSLAPSAAIGRDRGAGGRARGGRMPAGTT
jgi:hypothetical protein